jgi:catechol 2,3-dioxygenase-like lactoylglutathione lyase family enzyme
MSTVSPGLSVLGQIAFTVSDVERATVFFRDQLGLPFLFAAPPGLAFFDCGGVRLMVTKPEGAGAFGANSILYFKVADIAAAHTALQSRGVVFERPPAVAARMPDHELWLAAFRDPDGNILELMSEKR